jgi:hypothetical protein
MIVKGIRAFIVCVNYSDYLSITLPHNKNHFEDVIVVTDNSDKKTFDLCQREKVGCVTTDSFYDDDALFNKWKALNQALVQFSDDRWICLLDADILFPRNISFNPIRNSLYTPKRRIIKHPKDVRIYEDCDFKIHPLAAVNEEWAGYCQIFHSSDPQLGPHPWHEQNWRHAGGADSFFWMKWPAKGRLRPPFEVLHFGEDGQNWGGRITPLLNGEKLEGSDERRQKITELLSLRRGKPKANRYDTEKF